MKAILCALLLCAWWPEAVYAITIRTTIDLGRRSRNCESGFGICTTKTATASTIGDNVGSLTLSDDGMTLTLVIARAFPDERQGQIIAGKFIQQEDYQLPRNLCAALGLPGGIILPAGAYPATASGDLYMIRFPVIEVQRSTQ